MKKIAVILAGCGRMDGSEIHESVLTLLAIAQAPAAYFCFSLDEDQARVINHLTNHPSSGSRNMLVESARIARGEIKPLAELDVTEFDGLVIPGGNGTAANLFDLALKGAAYQVKPAVAAICRDFTAAGKPVGFICIAPVMVPAIYDFPVAITIGNDPDTAAIVTARGAIHHETQADEIWVDSQHKIVTTPAYMLATSITQVYAGIKKLVTQLIELTEAD